MKRWIVNGFPYPLLPRYLESEFVQNAETL
jgi:hypothetical protein